jgi:hypothetical protein
MKTKKKVHRLTSEECERLTTHELLAAHERVFGPLSAQAKQRMAQRASCARPARTWDGMDGLAA